MRLINRRSLLYGNINQNFTIILIIILFGFIVSFEHAPFNVLYAQEIKIAPGDLKENSLFGSSLALSNNFLIVGSKGIAYIYKRNNWNQYEIIHSQFTTHLNVDISENYAIVGVPQDSDIENNRFGIGSAYIFKHDGITGKWEKVSKLYANDALKNDFFGGSVSISDEFAVIGAYGKNNGSENLGSVYFFKRLNDENWVQDYIIDGEQINEEFGRNVSIYDEYTIMSSRKRYLIYKLLNNAWEKVGWGPFSPFDTYHSNVDINNQTAIVGGSSDFVNKGKVSCLQINENMLKTEYQVTLEDGYVSSVALQDEYSVAGISNKNKIYIFKKTNGIWIQRALINKNFSEDFGGSVALNANTLAVGSCFHEGNAYRSGCVYIYNNINQNFIIEGFIKDKYERPVKNVQVSFTNCGGLSTTTDERGFYQQKIGFGWSGEVIVQKENISFSPSQRTYNNVMNHMFDQDYQDSRKIYSISGFITDTSNTPISGVTIIFDNNGGTTTTNNQGYYQHNLYENWSGKLTPQGRGYKYVKSFIEYSNIRNDFTEQNFIGQKYSISGYIYDENLNPIPGIKMRTVSGSQETNTDSEGYYCLTADYQWTGQIIAIDQKYLFDPESISYTNLENNHINQNYIAHNVNNLTISGYILTNSTSSNIPIQGIKIEFTNKPTPAYTDASGFFQSEIDYNWCGSITPSKTGYSFLPESITYSDVIKSYHNQNFECLIDQNHISNLIITPEALQLSPSCGILEISISTGSTTPKSKWFTIHNTASWVKAYTTNEKILIQYSENNTGLERQTSITVTAINLEKILKIRQFPYQSDVPEWHVNIHDYQYQGMMTAMIQNETQNQINMTNSLLGAFVGNECRGSASSVEVSEKNLYFLQMWSNTNNEKISFKFFDKTVQITYENIKPDVYFTPEMELGNIVSPYTLTIHHQEHFPDANDDGKVDVIDAIDVLKYLIKTE